MPFIQDVIHKIEVGVGMRYIRLGLAVLAVALLTVGYNWRAFRNMACQEAMDSAQVARNLAQGKGFTTLFIRPLSFFLIKRHNQPQPGAMESVSGDPGRLKAMHPDLANPPVYPLLLAGLMKVVPFDYSTASTKPFWSNNGRFWRFKPDFIISLFNQLLFGVVVVITFFLARRLFDAPVAWLSSLLLLGSELFWRFSVSGLSTMLLVLVFMSLVWGLVELEQEIREPKRGPAMPFGLAIGIGLLVGLGALTRYSFGWLIIPVVAFLIVFAGPRRVPLALIALVAFAGAMAPWVVRNYTVSGTPFGTAGYAIFETTFIFPEHRLERSLDPDLGHFVLVVFWYKGIANLRQILQGDLPRLGGSWVSAFFLVGLLVGFRNFATRRVRYFLVACIAVLAITQALGRTQSSEDSPEINSENLLVILAPLVITYGVALFFLILEQMALPFLQLRYVVMGAFSAVACLPMIFVFLPPRGMPVAYPPYYPPAIQTIAAWMKPDELTMSDIPWAMAWYGQRQCMWITLRATPDFKDRNLHEDFFVINDLCKPIHAVYLTPMTMDSRFLSQWIQAGETSWGSFILQCMVTKEVPKGFPLSKSQPGWLPNQLVLTDWERWKKNPAAP